jgi:copper chaperone CopZ
MKKCLIVAAFVLGGTAAFGAETVKVTVGHLCCGGCKNAATAGLKNVAWVGAASAEGNDTLVVTAKEGQSAELIALVDALNKAGFPARQINVAGPVTMTIAHLCCPGCVNDLKAKVDGVRSQVLDKASVKIDATAKTLTLQPVAGRELNVASLLRSLQNQGFYPSSVSISKAVKSAQK